MSMQATINGKRIDGPLDMPLLWTLRDLRRMTGTKFGCGARQYGVRTVHLDGIPIPSSVLPVGDFRGNINAAEGVADTGADRRIQEAWLGTRSSSVGIARLARSRPPQLSFTGFRSPRRRNRRNGVRQYMPLHVKFALR